MAERLRRELGVGPSAVTRDLVEQLQTDTPARGPQHPATPQAVPIPAAVLPLVGRDAELAQLERAWSAAAAGAGAAAVIRGEAGIGKTRLATELRLCASAQPQLGARTAESAALDLGGAAPLSLWAELIRAATQARSVAALEQAVGYLEEVLAIQPGRADVWLELAELEAWRMRREQAEAAFERALELLRAGEPPLALARSPGCAGPGSSSPTDRRSPPARRSPTPAAPTSRTAAGRTPRAPPPRPESPSARSSSSIGAWRRQRDTAWRTIEIGLKRIADHRPRLKQQPRPRGELPELARQ